MAALLRFPPVTIDPADPTFLAGKSEAFAKLKMESKAGKRTVFLTEHTLIFVIKGVKLLHFPDHTLQVSPESIVLVRKGIYVMAEYMEEGLDFEALLFFLPGKLLRSLAAELAIPTTADMNPYSVFQANELTQGFKHQMRQYFGRPLYGLAALLAVKQKEILLLLMSSGYQAEVSRFIRGSVSSEPEDLDFIVRNYLLQPVTLQDLASLTNRSLASFKRDFQQRYNCAPRQWINRERLRQATLLLQNTDQQIAGIAESCGFESASYFIRLFKKEYSCTPSEWRAAIIIN